MKRMVIALIASVLLIPSVMAGGGGQTGSSAGGGTVYKLRASSNLAATGTVGMALTKFVELVNQKAGGRIQATANYGNELGNQSEQVEMCRGGSLEMVVSAPGTGPGTWVPQLGALDLPFIYTDNEHCRRILKEMEGEVSRLVTPIGFVARAGQSMGARHILTSKPVTKLADMRGLKMRGPNPMYVAMFQALGSTGTTTDWNEIYTAIQSHVIDGMEASPSMINSMKFQDVAKNMTITNHTIAAVYYFFNEKWLNSLPADLKQIVLDCADEAAVYQGQIDDVDQEKAMDSMIKEGLNVINLSDHPAWIAACSSMVSDYKAKDAAWNDFITKMLAIK
jgi:C4-dicarboxylate-binding protein DctP